MDSRCIVAWQHSACPPPALDLIFSSRLSLGARLVGDGMRTRMAVMEVAPSKHAAKHLPATAWESYAQRQLRLQAELRAKADDAELAAVIDHTLLKPSATAAEVRLPASHQARATALVPPVSLQLQHLRLHGITTRMPLPGHRSKRSARRRGRMALRRSASTVRKWPKLRRSSMAVSPDRLQWWAFHSGPAAQPPRQPRLLMQWRPERRRLTWF